MASLKLSISLDSYDSKKLARTATAPQLSDRCSISWFSGYVHIAGACIINPFGKFKHIRVSRLDAEVSDTPESHQLDGSIVRLDEDGDNRGVPVEGSDFNWKFRRIQGDVWKRFPRVRRKMKNENLNRTRRKIDEEREQGEAMLVYKKKNMDFLLDIENLLDFDVDAVGSDLNLERCNFILKQMESCDDGKALGFFEWMKTNGKLKQNATAYNLALRILGRKGDWHAAERVLQEMTTVSGCELNFQVFNTLIYPCYKRGLAGVGSKLFNMMLENGVRPIKATFGMLMSIYQKGRNLEEAEFTFSKMRKFGVKCESAYSAMITIYTRLGLYDKAEQTIKCLRDDKVILNKENWLVSLNAYSQQGKMEEAKLVLDAMREAGLSVNIIAYNTMITGYGKVSNMDAAHCLFHSLRDVGIEPDETTYRSMIEGWGRANNFREAEWYYKELKRKGFQPNSANLYTMIHLQAKYGDEEGAGRTLEDMLKLGCQHSSVLGILLKAYERAERLDRVPLVLQGSFYEHVLTNQTSCSIVVMAYVKQSLVDDALKILQDKRWKDQAFEDNMYHLLICSCKDLGHLENAVKIYIQMPRSHDKQNLHIMCTMLDIYSVMNLFKEAESLYLQLKSSGIALDMIAFSIVVRMYVKAGSLREACSVLETMEKQQNIVPDVYLLRDMLRIYQRCGMQNELANMYYKILRNGVAWDQEMYNCVINCCSRALPVDELSKLFDEMLQHGFTPNINTFNVMLNVYCKSKLFTKARKVFWVAKRRGLVDTISYNTLIAAYGQSRYLKNMSSTVRKMQFDGFSVSLEAYNCMLDAYGKEGQMDNFKSVLQRLRESSCAPDRYTYNIMINIYGEHRWIEEVANVLTELKESGLGPDLCGYNTLIKAYGIAGMVEDAVALVKEMREKGVEPDRITYVNLISALRNNDEILEAVKWSLWMKQMGL